MGGGKVGKDCWKTTDQSEMGKLSNIVFELYCVYVNAVENEIDDKLISRQMFYTALSFYQLHVVVYL